MTVKFEFSLPDDQAELMVGILRERALEYRDTSRHGDFFSTARRPTKQWFIDHAKLIDDIADKVAKSSKRGGPCDG